MALTEMQLERTTPSLARQAMESTIIEHSKCRRVNTVSSDTPAGATGVYCLKSVTNESTIVKMFRAEENAKSIVQAGAGGGADSDADDSNNTFSGATLKISGSSPASPEPETRQHQQHQGSGGATSSILSGSDMGMAATIPTSNSNLSDQPQPPVNAEQPQEVIFVKPKVGSPKNFFSFREGLLEQAVSDCVNIILRPANDTDIIGTWLLTEISHWDHERERIYILTSKTLLVVKYDFISLRILQNTKIRLFQIDTIRRGDIKYSEGSLIPERSEKGIRIMWNKGQPVGWMSSWNPFASDIPWKTITDHPLYTYQDSYNSPHIKDGLDKYRKYYAVEGLYEALAHTISRNNAMNADSSTICKFEEAPVLMDNYVGVAAMIHNKHNFGFFKVRGKFSF